jgi:hypothetical protein
MSGDRRFYELFMDSCPLSYTWRLDDGFVLDLVFVALVMAFFVVSAGYVVACDRLMK